jgi:hypothetical protein
MRKWPWRPAPAWRRRHQRRGAPSEAVFTSRVFDPVDDADAESVLWSHATAFDSGNRLECRICAGTVQIRLRTVGGLPYDLCIVTSSCPCGQSDHTYGKNPFNTRT